jgi:hypothetical protein
MTLETKAHGGARANSGAKKQDLVHLHILIPRELSEQSDALTVKKTQFVRDAIKNYLENF